MSIHLEQKDLINARQMEVAVNGPDGATHLILCTGIVNVDCIGRETYTFLVGPQISQRQFVRAIASGALSKLQAYARNLIADNIDMEVGANVVLVDANYDEEFGQVKVRTEVSSNMALAKLAISYNVSILAELPKY